MARTLLAQAEKAPPKDVKQGFEIKSDSNTQEIHSVAHDVTTVEDALRKAKVDTDVWEIERFLINSWECVGVELGRQPLWQVKVWLKRKVASVLVDSVDAICKRLEKCSPKFPKPCAKRVREPHLLEVGLYDVHFGKLAWQPETGTNYDLSIAEKVFANAVQDLVQVSTGTYDKIEKVLFPVGNDFLHVDNLESATTKGTRVDSDGRYAKISESAFMAVRTAIETFVAVSPVEICWIPGNHDRLASYYLCRELKAYFSKSKHVTVDVSPSTRKYHHYGNTLLGFCHGDKEPLGKLPIVMATERPQEWAQTTHHEWHCGHTHSKKKRDWISVDEHNGTVVRVLPSLCGTDAWHHENLYVGSKRAAECYLWDKTKGYTGHFSVGARE